MSASGAKNATLTYDPLGRLYQVTSGGATTRFLYDGDRLIAEYSTTGTVQHRYVHGAGVDEPLVWYEGATVSSTTRRYLHANHQGSIIATTNAAGAKLGIGTYDAYGVTTAPSTWRFQYTGQAAIPQLGLYYYKARFYNPALGRFMQTDPIGYQDDNNPYAYVGNDPLNKTDPTGKFWDTFADSADVLLNAGQVFGGVAAYAVGVATGNEALANAAVDGLRESRIDMGAAAAAVLVPGVSSGMLRTTEKGLDVAKSAENAADANRAASRAKGIPDSQIGPSGKPKVHTVEHATTKSAREAAERQAPPGGGARFDAHPKDGQKPHYQAEDAKGDNVKPVVHHCPPNKRC